MNNNPLLSILIPTKNREDYALKVVYHILQIQDDRIQLIIYDNSDTNKLENLLRDCLKDARIKYFYNNEVLSFVENFSLGISKCDGEYVTIIGDDDGITPFIIDIADWANKNGIEAITPSLPIIYNWPGSGVNSENGNGRLTISDFSSSAKFYDPTKEVIKLLKNGCQNYLSYNLAKAYHGMIKRHVLYEIKNKTGHFIGGLSPDIYISVAASLLIKKVLIIDYPLTISGICKKSGSADSATGKHTGNLEDAPHFIGHVNYEWSDKIPCFYSVETIWGDSALASLKDLKLNYLMKYFSIDAISGYCLNLYPQFKAIIIENLAKNRKTSKYSISVKFHLLQGLIKGPLIARLKAVKNQIFNKQSRKIFDNIPDIERASEIIQINMENKNILILERMEHINRETGRKL